MYSCRLTKGEVSGGIGRTSQRSGELHSSAL